MSNHKTLVEITMPQFAETLVSATIGKWLKKPGDFVEQYEPICDVITDKVNAELPSTVEGVLQQILFEEGQTVDVGTVICYVEVASAGTPAADQTAAAAPAQTPESTTVNAPPQPAGDQSMRGRYSPAVQHLAGEHGIDLRQVKGTGLGGRITRKDVQLYIEQGNPAPVQAEAAANTATVQPAVPLHMNPGVPVRHSGLHLSESPKLPDFEVEGRQSLGQGEYFIDVTPIRSTIARNMRQSVTEIPHAWTTIEVDVTNLVLLRNKHKEEFMRQEGVNLTYLAFLLKAVVNAIKDYPIMNSVWAVDKIIVKRDINLSLAVGTEDSVITPVIKKADQLNIAGLAREADRLAKKTRAGKLTLDDLQGGTFTINNTGSFGSILSYPIINYPQAAILTFESIVKRPVVINDMIAVRSMANLCLSLDHRILDGVICGRFLQRVKDNLEGFDLDTKLY